MFSTFIHTRIPQILHCRHVRVRTLECGESSPLSPPQDPVSAPAPDLPSPRPFPLHKTSWSQATHRPVRRVTCQLAESSRYAGEGCLTGQHRRERCRLIFAANVLIAASTVVSVGAEPKGATANSCGAPWPAAAPPDAMILFGGAEELQFLSKQGGGVDWPVVDGALVSTRGETRSNHIVSRLHFRDAEIHVEFQLPMHGSGNSGIYIHGHYELQIIAPTDPPVLDDHTLGAIYGFSAPQLAAGRPRGEWQVYDIRYCAPRRDADGTIVQPARISAWLNGRLIQCNEQLFEPRSVYHPYRYRSTPYLQAIQRRQLATSTGPLFLQDHDSPVRFRNIWIRPLDDRASLLDPPKSQ